MVLVGRIIEGYARVAANLLREVEDDVSGLGKSKGPEDDLLQRL